MKITQMFQFHYVHMYTRMGTTPRHIKIKIKHLRNKTTLISHVEKTCSVTLSLVYFAQRDDLQPHPIILLPVERLHSCLWLTKTLLCKYNTFYSFCHCSEVRFVSSCDHCKQYRVKGKCWGVSTVPWFRVFLERSQKCDSWTTWYLFYLFGGEPSP